MLFLPSVASEGRSFFPRGESRPNSWGLCYKKKFDSFSKLNIESLYDSKSYACLILKIVVFSERVKGGTVRSVVRSLLYCITSPYYIIFGSLSERDSFIIGTDGSNALFC